MLRNIHKWLPTYIQNSIKNLIAGKSIKFSTDAVHVLFTVCDHFEPFWMQGSKKTAYNRVKSWVEAVPEISDCHNDSRGHKPIYCFFYPEEEYDKELLEMIALICKNGLGEVEIHLHHDNDTPENMKNTLIDFKNKLSGEHGLLCRNKKSSNVHYGFIHGNWALDNSRPDGRWCGINNELDVLVKTGCYADFTMPSAPDITQTRTINRIYYAIDDPQSPKSHNRGIRAIHNKSPMNGLLCIQGPLGLNFKMRKFGLIPKIENSCVAYDYEPAFNRAKIWVNSGIHVGGRPDIVFVKLYTHGTQEKNIDFLLKMGGLDRLYSIMEEHFNDGEQFRLHYVSARQMYNAVCSLEKGIDISDNTFFESELVPIQ